MRLLISLIIVLLTGGLNAQLTVNSAPTATNLVQNVLVGNGITVSNITYSGDALQKGSFNGASSNLGINTGIVFSTGDVNDAVGPNNDGGVSTDFSFFMPSADPDIDQLIGFNTAYDLVKLEFDFVPTGDTVSFNYVFGSDEYPEFVNASFNDAFGFFLSGPGIAGPFSNGAKNIALVPGTNTFISIDNVNSGLNSQYYVDNGNGLSAPQNTDNTVVQCDGFTTKLSATSSVQCGQTYHIKIAIADVGDGIYDSWVFLEGGTFNVTSGTPTQIVANNSASGDTLICAGQGVDVQAIPGSPNYISMIWNDPNIPNTPGPHTVYPIDTTIYEVYTTYLVCGDTLRDTASITVNVAQIDPPDLVADTLFGCIGLNVDFTGSAGEPISDWKWFFGDGDSAIIQNPSHTYTSEGSYDVRLEVTNMSGCKGFITQTAYIQIHPNPTADFIIDDSIFCTAPALVNFTDNSSITSGVNSIFDWDYGDGNTGAGANSSNNYTDYGTYTAKLIVTSDIGCKDSTSKNIFIDPKPVADFISSDTMGCEPLVVDFQDNSTVINPGNISSWNWNFGNTNTSTLQNPNGISFSAGSYDISLEVITDFGCRDTITKLGYINAFSNPIADFNLSDSLMCGIPSTISFTDQSTDVSGNITEWTWNFDNGNISTQQNPTETFNVEGVYTISLLVVTEYTCFDTITKQLTIAPKPSANFSVDTNQQCSPYTFSFTDQSSVITGAINSWTWDFGNGETSNSQNPNMEFTNSGTFDVSLIIQTQMGCKDTLTEIDYITLNPSPIADFTSSQSDEAIFDQTVEFNNTSQNHTSSYWNFGDGDTSSLESISHKYNSPQEYVVTLAVANKYNCVDVYSETVLVKGLVLLYVPNAFTPDGNNNNDLFFAKGNYIKDFELRVFDQWGAELFYTNDIDKGWDGTYNNIDAPTDVYIWRAEYKDYENNLYKEIGHVTLIR